MRFMYIVTSAHPGPPTPELLEVMHKLAQREIKAGRNNLYQLHPEPLCEIDEWLAHYRHMWQHRLRNLKRYVEQKGKEH